MFLIVFFIDPVVVDHAQSSIEIPAGVIATCEIRRLDRSNQTHFGAKRLGKGKFFNFLHYDFVFF